MAVDPVSSPVAAATSLAVFLRTQSPRQTLLSGFPTRRLQHLKTSTSSTCSSPEFTRRRSIFDKVAKFDGTAVLSAGSKLP